MKRLGVFVSILMLSIGLFGGFSSPEKAMAIIDQGQAIQILNEALQILNKPDVHVNPITPEKKQTLIDGLTEIANQTYFTGPKDITLNEFKVSLFDKFRAYLIDNGAPLYGQSVYNLLQIPAENAVKVDNNQLTQERASLLNAQASGRNDQAMKTAEAVKTAKGACKIDLFDDTSKFSITACIDEGVTWLIKNTLLQIGGFLVWLTANMFNYAVQEGILQFSKWAPDALYPIWTIVRQIVSLVIVFAGLYLGFMYILGDEKRFEKFIPWVIAFGLFVNFSYPLTRTIIDISNITSLNIYASAVGPDALTAKFTDQNTAGALIMNKLGLNGLVLSATSAEDSGLLSSVNSIPGALLAVIYVFYAAYIFFQVTAIILMRTLALVFITIASPLLLVDSVLPMLGTKAKELRGIFFDQLIVGPVFMIMLALTLKFLDVFARVGPDLNTIGSDATGADTIVTFFNIMMMLGMLHIMIKVTKNFSGKLGEIANNAFGTVSGIGLGMATGGLGLLGRQGIGRLAANAQSRGWVSKDPNSMGGRIANTLSTSSFDIRNSNVIAGAAGKLGMNRGILGMGGMGGGAASKASFQSNADAKAKRIEASANARFKTKYERDTVDEDGFHRKGDDNLKQIKARQEFMASKGSSLFLTKEQQQKFIDDETDAQADRSLADHNKLKTKDAKEKNLTKLKQDLETSKLSDPKLESAKSQALVRTIYDIEKKDKDEKEAFEKQVDNAMFTYDKKTGADREKYLTNQTKEIHEAMQARINPTTSTSSPTTTTTPLSSTSSPSSSSTPLVADTDWGQLNSPAVNRREKAATSQAPVTTTTTPSSSSGGSPIPEAMVPFPTLDGAPSAPAPLTGIALREERIKKVAEGRAADVEMMKNEVENLKGTDTPESVQRQVQGVSEYVQERQQNSAAKAKVFGDRSSHFAQRRAERQRLATEQLNRTAPQSQNQAPAPQPTQQVEEEVTS